MGPADLRSPLAGVGWERIDRREGQSSARRVDSAACTRFTGFANDRIAPGEEGLPDGNGDDLYTAPSGCDSPDLALAEV